MAKLDRFFLKGNTKLRPKQQRNPFRLDSTTLTLLNRSIQVVKRLTVKTIDQEKLRWHSEFLNIHINSFLTNPLS